MITYLIENFKKHKITIVEVDEVLSDPHTIWLDLGTSKRGNDRLMFIGPTKAGRILEIGIELADDNELVFHAMNAGNKYKKEFDNVHKRNS